MSLVLSNSVPSALIARARQLPGERVEARVERPTTLFLGDYEIPMEDFRELMMYVMCNTPLAEDDPRLELLEDIKDLTVVVESGYRHFKGTRPLAQHYQF